MLGVHRSPGEPGGNGQTPVEGDGGTPQPFDWEAWLKGQKDDVRTAYDAHVAGLKSALDKERTERLAAEKADRERKAAGAEAEKQRLAEQGKFKELAEQAEARAKELEAQAGELPALKERAAKLEAALKAQLDAARKDVPKHIGELLDRMDVADQLTYLAAHGNDLKPAGGGAVPGTPRPESGALPTDEERRKKATNIRQYGW